MRKKRRTCRSDGRQEVVTGREIRLRHVLRRRFFSIHGKPVNAFWQRTSCGLMYGQLDAGALGFPCPSLGKNSGGGICTMVLHP